jgi:hypothetical protein
MKIPLMIQCSWCMWWGGMLAYVKYANFAEGKTLLTEVKYRYVNYDGGVVYCSWMNWSNNVVCKSTYNQRDVGMCQF